MKITCEIITDLMPSYIDNVCSEDSRELVEKHINQCEKCRKVLEDMRHPIECPTPKEEMESKDPFLKIRKKERIKIVISVIITCVLMIGLGVAAVKWNKLLPYDLDGTYSAGKEPDDTNIYMVFRRGEYTIYNQHEVLASGSVQEINSNDELEIYELFSEDNSKMGNAVHDKNKIILTDYQDEVVVLEKISRVATFLEYESDLNGE